jgi:hypothetical protein
MEPLSSMIDRLQEVNRQLKTLAEEKEGLVQELKDSMESGEVLLGSNGAGYRLTEQTSLEYGSDIFTWIQNKGLAPHFMKVSTTGLEKLVKAKALNREDFNTIQTFGKEKTTLVLREFVPEEAKVFS